jgi:hypothetical protein
MMAMASWVKPLAVPGPPPGPCEAKAALADSKVAAEAPAKASRDIECLRRDITISCVEAFAEDTRDSPGRF